MFDLRIWEPEWETGFRSVRFGVRFGRLVGCNGPRRTLRRDTKNEAWGAFFCCCC